MSSTTANLYDHVPYPTRSYSQTHPDQLATVARLFGMKTAPVDQCRVLELGCGNGANLLPMAATLPDSLFVGIDTCLSQIAVGQEAVKTLGLKNLFLDAQDLRSVPADAGPFDYIIVHDVFSWVGPEIQGRILDLCQKNLAPQGLAYINYSTYPGWHGSELVSDMLHFHLREIAGPQQRGNEARTWLNLLAQAIKEGKKAFPRLIVDESQRLNQKSIAQLLHLELGDQHWPLYFHEFMSQASSFGLQFVAEAEVQSMTLGYPRPDVRHLLEKMADDPVGREQYLDFLVGRAERQTLLARTDVSLDRNLSPTNLSGFLIATTNPYPLDSGQAASLHPLAREAMNHLASIWPNAVPWATLEIAARARLQSQAVSIQSPEALLKDSRLLAENLWQEFWKRNIELHVFVPQYPAKANELPLVPPHVRFQASRGNEVCNLRHETIPVDDLARLLLVHMDGQHNRADLLEGLMHFVTQGQRVVQARGQVATEPGQIKAILAENLESLLQSFARLGLLVR